MIDSFVSLAETLFPNVPSTHEELLTRYPKRNNAPIVTRFAPSPTGFLHIGGVYSALLGERIAHQDDGIFYYRTEDTDAKREVD